MRSKEYCSKCADETNHDVEIEYEESFDDDIDEDDLDRTSYISRCNGDQVRVSTCKICFSTSRDM